MFSTTTILLIAVSLSYAGRPQNINVSSGPISGPFTGSITPGTSNFGSGTQFVGSNIGQSSGSRQIIGTSSGGSSSTGTSFGQNSGSSTNTGGSSIGTGSDRIIGVLTTGSNTGGISGIGVSNFGSNTGSDGRINIGQSFQGGINFGQNTGSRPNIGSSSSIGAGSDRVIGGFTTGSNTGGVSGIGVSNFGSSTGTDGQINIGQSFQGGLNFGQFIQQLPLTITVTATVDSYVTLTETIFNSVPVTLTGFTVNTITVTTLGAHQTNVDNIVSIRTTVLERPVTDFVTIAKSNFVYVTDLSVEIYTITHSEQLIHQTTHTTVATQTLTMSSPVVRTHLTTSVATQTEFQTIVNTVFVHGYQ